VDSPEPDGSQAFECRSESGGDHDGLHTSSANMRCILTVVASTLLDFLMTCVVSGAPLTISFDPALIRRAILDYPDRLAPPRTLFS
jgi:hypothetical protein